jgi:hypothetical protein
MKKKRHRVKRREAREISDYCEGCGKTFRLSQLHQSPPETGDGLLYCADCVGPSEQEGAYDHSADFSPPDDPHD